MPKIMLLDQDTIDQIAAGEVVERPVSVVKELVENAVDAGAMNITVEIKEGGISFIRVTDDGCGIEKEQLAIAFQRHATSKIRDSFDLLNITSLGFRGEALSSIAAVSRVEVITKTRESLTGVHYIMTAGEEPQVNEIGAPNGSTFLVRNLFFNVPVRRKFLKKSQTEGSYITDLMERLALSRPDISFKYINNGLTRFHTSGHNDLKEVIYRLFGKGIASNIIPISAQSAELGIRVDGFLGLPALNRANRNFEFFFINGRYVTSDILKTGLEDGYHPYLMHHRFPFTILMVTINTDKIDVNVHPGKLEVRLTDEKEIIDFIAESVKNTLAEHEHISAAESISRVKPVVSVKPSPEPFEIERIRSYRDINQDLVVNEKFEYKLQDNLPNLQEKSDVLQDALQGKDFKKLDIPLENMHYTKESSNIIKQDENVYAEQLRIFDGNFLSLEAKGNYEVLGQVFGVYWLVLMDEKLIFIDQHAAHEKVKYEQLLSQINVNQIDSQNINPPIVLELSKSEEDILLSHMSVFARFGFEIDELGDSSYALRAVPAELFGLSEKGLFNEILDELSDFSGAEVYEVVEKKVAGAACKAAVKANKGLSREEFNALVELLIGLNNPYFCPHGRPTMVMMSKREVERKFKRV